AAFGRADSQVGREDLTMFGDWHAERRRDGLTLGNEIFGKLQRPRQDETDPRDVEGLVRMAAELTVLPLLVGEPEIADLVGVVSVEALREGPEQRRHAQERARRLDQGQPLGVVTGRGHRATRLPIHSGSKPAAAWRPSRHT